MKSLLLLSVSYLIETDPFRHWDITVKTVHQHGVLGACIVCDTDRCQNRKRSRDSRNGSITVLNSTSVKKLEFDSMHVYSYANQYTGKYTGNTRDQYSCSSPYKNGMQVEGESDCGFSLSKRDGR